MSNEMLTVPQWDLQHPAANYRMATDVAALCKEIVLKSAVDIHGKKYVRAEGWQAIATAHGCVASARDVEHVEGGIRAIGEVRKVSDGIVIATAEGFVGDDEPMWQKRPEYARRAMCQTRAISRACRSAFAHVVVLMDAGLATTPAEEVPDEGFDDAQPTGRAATPRPLRITRPSHPARDTSGFMDTNGEPSVTGEGISADEPAGNWKDVVVHFGKWKNTRLGDLEPKSLNWYANLSGDGWEPRPFRGKFSQADITLYDALNEYRLTQGKPPRALPGQQPGNDEDLEEVPF